MHRGIYEKILIIYCFIFIYNYTQYIFGNSISCNKDLNICTVKPLFNNNIINKFDYDKIDNLSCKYRNRVYSLVFKEETKIVNGIYEFGKEYNTIEFSSKYVCEYAKNKFIQYKNSNNNQFNMRGYHTFLISLLIFGIIIFGIIYLIDTIR